ncbi:DUF881 domain-containing protein [Nocardioides sp.]|uniref:DUF881 domain-containing protein n=1 Tax=Nocardioides sp. TaxID=35761 RepID=UPI002ED3782D
MVDPTDGPEARGRGEGAAQPLPEHVTTPLLSRITQGALDSDYAQVARRRAETSGDHEPARNRVVAGAVIAVFGVLISIAVVQNTRNEAVDDAGRTTLISRIEEERSALEDRQAQLADLTRENRQLAAGLTELASARSRAEAAVARLGTVTGYARVSGEGVRIVVDDNPIGNEVQLVTDSDLAMLTDGLWEAGAEAIAINDQRLTPLGAIRNSGRAIHVNTVPLSPPYVVRAIGDMRTLQANLLETTHGAEFFSLADQLGFVYSVDNASDLELPAARQRRLNYVRTGTAEQMRGGLGAEEGQP